MRSVRDQSRRADKESHRQFHGGEQDVEHCSDHGDPGDLAGRVLRVHLHSPLTTGGASRGEPLCGTTGPRAMIVHPAPGSIARRPTVGPVARFGGSRARAATV